MQLKCQGKAGKSFAPGIAHYTIVAMAGSGNVQRFAEQKSPCSRVW